MTTDNTPDTARLTPEVLDRLETRVRDNYEARNQLPVPMSHDEALALIAAARESTPAPTESACDTCDHCGADVAVAGERCSDCPARTAPASEVAAGDVSYAHGVWDGWHQRDNNEPEPPRPESSAFPDVAAPQAEIERAHRLDWADYIEGWDGAVGPERQTVRSIVSALRRSSPPFGKAAADRMEADA